MKIKRKDLQRLIENYLYESKSKDDDYEDDFELPEPDDDFTLPEPDDPYYQFRHLAVGGRPDEIEPYLGRDGKMYIDKLKQPRKIGHFYPPGEKPATHPEVTDPTVQYDPDETHEITFPGKEYGDLGKTSPGIKYDDKTPYNPIKTGPFSTDDIPIDDIDDEYSDSLDKSKKKSWLQSLRDRFFE